MNQKVPVNVPVNITVNQAVNVPVNAPVNVFFNAAVNLIRQSLRLNVWRCPVALALSTITLLSACSSEPPPTPPTPLNAIDGDVRMLRLWRSEAGDAGSGLFEPLVVDDKIIVANGKGVVNAFATETGMRQWRRDLDITLTSGVGGSGDLALVSDAGANVHAMNIEDGALLWDTQASSEILMPVVSDYGVVAVRSADGRVAALEPGDGAERWSYSSTPPALSLNGYSRPLLVQGGVLLGLDDGRMLALDMSSGRLIWETVLSLPSGRSEVERLVDIDADIVVDNEGIYVANYQGRAARLEPARGQIVWSTQLSAGSGIAVEDEALIVVDENDNIIKLDKATGRQVWINDTMTARHFSPPAFTPAGDIVIGDVEGYVHVLDADTGEAIGRTRPSREPIKARPVLVDETMYVLATDGYLSSFRFTR